MTISKTTADITAQNTYSDPVRISGRFNVLIAGTFVATVNVQRSFSDPDVSADWHNVSDAYGNTAFTAPATFVGEEPEGAWYRAGVATGNYTSGTAELRISQ